MMQMPVYQVIDVITMRHSRMPTVRAVNMVFIVAFAVVGNAPVGVGVRDRYDMLVVVAFMRAVQVSAVQISHMVAVLDG